METILTKNTKVHFGTKIYDKLNRFLKSGSPSKVFILTDTNTHDFCLPKFMAQLQADAIQTEVMEMPEGEDHKTIDICMGVWEALSLHGADRKSVLLNLGGGVVTDLGGFVASTYMRGITYINIPTSLLAMVDASVGGKTGVDLGALKNQVGVFSEGEMVLIDSSFLETLPQNHMVSGFAEMLKHGLISDKNYWHTLTHLEDLDISDLDQMIYDSVVIKNSVVTEDPKEKGLRKILNFGHTIGHAIESYFLERDDKNTLLHGEAIAIGMIVESYISTKISKLSKDNLNEISEGILKTFAKVEILQDDYSTIIDFMKHDKKNSHGIVKFVLLKKIGKAVIDCEVPENLIKEALDYYNAL